MISLNYTNLCLSFSHYWRGF